MKKVTKILIIISLVFIGIGAIMTLAGIARGGFDVAKNLASGQGINVGGRHGLYLNIGKNGISIGPNGSLSDYIDDESIDFDNDYESFTGNVSNSFNAAKSKGVNKLDINAGRGDLYVYNSDTDEISYMVSSNRKSQCYIKGDTLYLRAAAGEIALYIPAGTQFDEANIDVGLGNFYAESLMIVNDMNLDIGAGEFTANSIYLKDADIDVGAGNMTLSGDITGDLNLKCGMGSAHLYLESRESDHSHSANCGMGNISYGSTQISGIGNRFSSDDKLDSHFDIECGMGDVVVTFAD